MKFKLFVNPIDSLADISGGKRKAPPKAEKLVDHHLDVVRNAIAKHPGHPLVLAGKSMGSRYSLVFALCRYIHIVIKGITLFPL